MISNILSKASKDIQHYLIDPAYDGVYTGEVREQIEDVVLEMESVREKLDYPQGRPALAASLSATSQK